MTPFKAFIASSEFVELGRRVPAYRNPDQIVQPLRPATVHVYTLMFGKFNRWMRDHGKTLFTVSDDDILQFLNSRIADHDGVADQLKSTIRVKYVRMLERVFQHLEVAPNPAQSTAFQIYKTAGASGRDLDMVVMDQAQQEAFMQALPVANGTPAGWKRRRDRAMQALMLGAGLTVAEVMHTKLRDLGAPDSTGSCRSLSARNPGRAPHANTAHCCARLRWPRSCSGSTSARSWTSPASCCFPVR